MCCIKDDVVSCCHYEITRQNSDDNEIGEQTSVFHQATDQHHILQLEAQPSLPVQPKNTANKEWRIKDDILHGKQVNINQTS